MASTLSKMLGLIEDKAAPSVETRSVRLDARPRICKQSYGEPYLKMICSDGSIAIVVNAQAHRELTELKSGDEIKMKGRWTLSRLHETYRDEVFHVEAVVS